MTYAFARNKFRVRGDTIEVYPAYEERAVRIQLFGDEVERIASVDPLTGEVVEELDRLVMFAASHYVTDDDHMQRCDRGHRRRARGAARVVRGARQAARGAAPAHAHHLRPRDDAGDRRAAPASRTTRASSTAAAPGERPYTLLDYFPEDFLWWSTSRTSPSRRSTAMYRRRPLAQGHARRVRVPPPLGPRQPAAALRGVRQAVNQVLFMSATPARTSSRNPRQVVEQIIRPTGLIDPDVLVRRPRADRRPRRRDPNAHRPTRSGARHHAHQEDGRGPHRVPRRAGHPGPVPAQRDRHARTGRDPPRPAAGRVRRAGRHQPPPRGARPPRGVAGARSSTRTRRVSSAPRRR